MSNRNNANEVNLWNKVNLDIEMGSVREPVVGTGSGVAVTPPSGMYFTAIFNQGTAPLVISAVTGINGGSLLTANLTQNATWLVPCTSFTPTSGLYCAYLAALTQG